MARLLPSPHWTIAADGERLVVTGGADAVYSVEDLEPAAIAWVIDAWASGAIDSDEPTGEAARAVQELLGAGVLVPDLPLRDAGRPTIRLVWAGRRAQALAVRLQDDAAASHLTIVQAAADLDVIVRTSATLAEMAELQDSTTPTLLVDCAYQHTVSLGPLMVPRATACLRCYAERLTARWSDAQPPVSPQVLDDVAFISALTIAEASRALKGASVLVNRTAAYNRDTHIVLREALHRTPGCLLCDPRVRTPDVPALVSVGAV